MRRGLGVGAVQRGRQMNQQFKKVGAEMAEENMKQMRESLAVFQKSLEDFAEKHAKQIKKDPQFRQVCYFISYQFIIVFYLSFSSFSLYLVFQ